jgi:hypothetical protein
VASATTTTDPATRTVTFDGSGSSDPDGDTLTYTWDFGDGTPSGTGMKSTHTYAPGANTFTATLTVTDPLGLTNTTPPITVAPSNHSPDLVLTDPGSHTFAVGEAVSVSAAATDADEPGTQLPITWTSLVRHCPTAGTCHVHPGVGQTGPTFTLPFVDHPDSRMEFVATATDKAGVSVSKTYVARPTDHRLTLVSNVPAALQIPLEGAGVSTAMVTEAAQFTVEAAAVATDGASAFLNWQGGPATRVWPITVGTTDMTLTANYSTAIDQRYNADPALRTMLGTPTGPEVVSGSVSYRVYQNGRLYWSKATGVHELHGTILAAYLNLGGQAKMGPPRTDQTAVSDGIGQFNDFDGTSGTGPASIYWTAKTGAHAVWGRIRVKWAQLGFGKGVLGYPTTDEQVTPDGTGRFNHFSKDASIYWTVGTDAHSVQGRIRARWAAQGWELGQAGYPTTDELSTPDGFGRYNHFTKGASIYWAPPTDAHVVVGVIRDRWAALGWEGSYLGYLTSDEFGIPGGRRSNFQSGFITWNASTGVVIDRRY